MILQDWSANRGNVMARVVIMLFRLAYLIRHGSMFVILIGIPYLILSFFCREGFRHRVTMES